MHYRAQAINQYARVRTHGGVESATPHQLVTLLLDGALDGIAGARGHMQRHEVAAKGEAIGRSIGIIEGLRASLDHERGDELSANLDALYEYAARRLLLANRDDDAAALDEVAALLEPVREAWTAIAPKPTQPQATAGDRA